MRSLRLLRTLSLVLTLSVLWIAPVHAEDAYRALTSQAVEEHSLGHYEEARALFERAHAINPNARTQFGMGTAAFEARQYVDAIQLLQAALVDQRKPLTAAQTKEADAMLKRSENFVVRVRVALHPASAALSVDGRQLDLARGGDVLLDAGTHQIVASAAGHRDWVRSVRWSAGEATLEVRLEPATSPPQASELASGEASAHKSPAADASPPQSSTLAVLKWVSLGAALASAGVAGAGLGLYEAAATKWNDERKCPPDKNVSCPGVRDDTTQWKTMGIVGAATAGTFAILTTTFFVLDRKRDRQAGRAHALCVPLTSPGVGCQVRF